MSFFSIVAQLLGLVPGVTKAAEAIADATRKHDVPRDISRKHHWQYGLSNPPVCAYCQTVQTQRNVLDWCPAFEVKS